MENKLEFLWQELTGCEGSFLYDLRGRFEWDKVKFQSLIEAMTEWCENNAEAKSIERWMADGFWYLATAVKEIISHPNFPRIYDDQYYDNSCKKLENLATWFFSGNCPVDNSKYL